MIKRTRRWLTAKADEQDWAWLAARLNPGQRTRAWSSDGHLIADSDHDDIEAIDWNSVGRVELYPPSVIRLASPKECRRVKREILRASRHP